MSKPQALICPYCGETQPAGDVCRACGGLFEPLSRQATHNEMGPWFIRNPARPFQPGCSYETLVKLLERGQVNRHTLLRGPTTKQFWTIAKRVPGVAHLLGYCHQCDAEVNPGEHGCPRCGVPFGAYPDRNHLGLPEVRPLPWEADGTDARVSAAHAGGRINDGGDGRPGWSDAGSTAQARGLSSFATDQELLGAAQPLTGNLVQPELSQPHASAASFAPLLESRRSVAVHDAPGDSPTWQAMQQSLRQQQRTTRLLFGIITVLAITLAIVLLRANGLDSAQRGAGESPPAGASPGTGSATATEPQPALVPPKPATSAKPESILTSPKEPAPATVPQGEPKVEPQPASPPASNPAAPPPLPATVPPPLPSSPSGG